MSHFACSAEAVTAMPDQIDAYATAGTSPPQRVEKLNRRAFGFTRRDAQGLAALEDSHTVARFFAKVRKSANPKECWIWTSTRVRGYGSFSLGKTRRVRAARFAFALTYGPLPDGHDLDHRCRNIACVNPTHLEAVTPRTNVLRGNGWAGQHARKTHCPRGHELAGDNLEPWFQRRGQRRCRTCFRAYDHARYARRKAAKVAASSAA